jgi:hypothetical protein
VGWQHSNQDVGACQGTLAGPRSTGHRSTRVWAVDSRFRLIQSQLRVANLRKVVRAQGGESVTTVCVCPVDSDNHATLAAAPVSSQHSGSLSTMWPRPALVCNCSGNT